MVRKKTVRDKNLKEEWKGKIQETKRNKPTPTKSVETLTGEKFIGQQLETVQLPIITI